MTTTTIEVPAGAKILNIIQESGIVMIEFAPKFKEGDFLYSDAHAQETILIFKKIHNNRLYYYVCMKDGKWLDFYELNYWTNTDDFRLATEVEQQQLLYMMKKKGKQWNAEKLCIEDIPTYKKGDFLVKEYKNGQQCIFILDYIDDDGLIYYHCCHTNRFDTLYVVDDYGIGRIGDSRHKCLRYATDSEKELMVAKLFKVGKRWDAEKLCIENIPQRKFKPGDKVKLKDGILDKNDESLYFAEDMHVFIGKVLTVGSYTSKGYLYLNEGNGWAFAEDWFELYSDEPIIGELAIFWDSFKELSHIRIYTQRLTERYGDHRGGFWTNAIKFESKEQFLEHIKD